MLVDKKIKGKVILVLLLLFCIAANKGYAGQDFLLSQKGEMGIHVEPLQEGLSILGYYQGEIDGIFGSNTEEALKKFQRDSGLADDGIAGMRTWEALTAALEDDSVFYHQQPDEEKTENESTDEETTNFDTNLERGDQGRAVYRLNELLSNRGFLHKNVDDIFDLQTELAVKLFQKYHGIQVDGIAGPVTREALEETEDIFVNYTVKSGDTIWDLASRWKVTRQELLAANNLENPDQLRPGDNIVVPTDTEVEDIEKISWNRMEKIFQRKDTVIITDLETGLHLQLRRLGGTYHADSEPLTAQDTSVLRQIYGGEWSWERRAVVVHIRGYRVAASINGVPHGSQSITDNNFSGHICVHFRGSFTHNSEQQDPEHQQMIDRAADSSWPLGLPR